jgi:hypothetical protein
MVVIGEDREYGEVAQSLLRLFSFLNPDGILLEFLARGVDAFSDNLKDVVVNEVRFDGVLKLLQRFSLIKITPNPRSVTMHRMVQEVIQHNLDDDHVSRVWDGIGTFFSLAYPEPSDRQSLLECRKYQNQVLPSLLRVPDNLQSESVCFALDRFGSFLSHDGKYVAGRKIMEKMVPMVKIIWGAKSLIALGATLDLTAIYRLLGFHEKALSLAHTVLKESRENWGEKHEITLRAMEHVALWLGKLRRYEDAIKLQEIVYETRKEVLVEKDPATISTRTDLTRLLDVLKTQKSMGTVLWLIVWRLLENETPGP